MFAANFGNEKIFQRSDENFSVRRQKFRAERNLAIMNEVKNLIGDDIPWRNEDEMIRELAEMRRQNLRQSQKFFQTKS